jgi:hypothetical protein
LKELNMKEEPQVIDYVKAVSDPQRLRIIGALAQQPATIRELAAQLNISFRQAFRQVGLLEFAGVIRKEGDLLRLDDGAVEHLSKAQLSAPNAAPVLPADLDDKSRRVLSNFLKQELSVRQLPAQAPKLQAVLRYVAAAFHPGESYSERQVNEILRGFHPDTASLRRYLVDAALLRRESDGSRYWRTPEESR